MQIHVAENASRLGHRQHRIVGQSRGHWQEAHRWWWLFEVICPCTSMATQWSFSSAFGPWILQWPIDAHLKYFKIFSLAVCRWQWTDIEEFALCFASAERVNIGKSYRHTCSKRFQKHLHCSVTWQCSPDPSCRTKVLMTSFQMPSAGQTSSTKAVV